MHRQTQAQGLDMACLAFQSARQTFPNYIVNLYYYYYTSAFPCNAIIPPGDGVDKAKCILSFMQGFYVIYL